MVAGALGRGVFKQVGGPPLSGFLVVKELVVSSQPPCMGEESRSLVCGSREPRGWGVPARPREPLPSTLGEAGSRIPLSQVCGKRRCPGLLGLPCRGARS